MGFCNIALAMYAFFQTFHAIHGCNPNSFILMNSGGTLLIHLGVLISALTSFTLGFIVCTKPWVLFVRRAYDYAYHVSTTRAMLGFVLNPVIIGYVGGKII
ncbi:MAG: hypothetical protein H6849_03135 [Alphaproteobacteria bacterium]|nr:MAG: hypothetical protein H6849_03135 [Alphaproteobacteria bacterium]